MDPSRAGEAAFQHQEIAFSVCMAAVAILVRGNPLYSPNLLWGFAALLAFNLAYHMALRRRGETWYVPMISMAANTVLVTLLLHLSGGADSPFWPMYLIPIFTACLYLDSRHVAFAAAASSAFLAALSLSAADPDTPFTESAAQLVIKAAVLAVSAGVTARHAFRERRARVELSAVRAELERLETDMAKADRQRAGTGMSRFLAGLVYDLNGRLTLIRGRAELLTAALSAGSPPAEDARGIAEAARALGRLGSDLLRVLQNVEEGAPKVAAAPLVEQVLGLVEFRLGPRGLTLERDLPADLPRVSAGAPHLQQALLELVETAAESARPGSVLSVRAEKGEHDGVDVRLRFEPADARGEPPSPAPQSRLLESFGGSAKLFRAGAACEYVVHFPAGARSRSRRAH